MLEQQLINAFTKFAAKAGAGALIRDLIRQVDENGNPKAWTAAEMHHAIEFLNQQTQAFARKQATQVARTLMKKFELKSEDLYTADDSYLESDELTGVQGLQ